MKGLIVKEPWIDMILDGSKTLEIRGKNTNIRGPVALIKSGSGMVFGTVDITGSFPINRIDAVILKRRHRISDHVIVHQTYQNPHAWDLSNPKKFKNPVPYRHPQGAVVWVNLPDNLFERVSEDGSSKDR